MKENPLYYVIQDNFPNTLLGHSVLHKVQDNRYYFICELPFAPSTWNIGGSDIEFVLSEHHLTIDRRILESSQYHYTALFTGCDDRSYRLHVYFNESDALTKQPILQLASDDEKPQYTDVDITPELSYQFLNLAGNQAFSLISECRRTHNNTLSKLENQFHKNMQEMSRLWQSDCRKQRCDLVAETKPLVQKLTYNGDNQHYHGVLQFLESYIEQGDDLTQCPSEFESDDVFEEIISESDNATQKVVPKPRPKPKTNRLAHVQRLIEAATQAKQCYENNTTSCNISNAQLLNDYEKALNSIRAQRPRQQRVMHILRVFEDDLQTKGARLLTRCLLSNNLTLAEEFSKYFQNINPNILGILVRTNNTNALELLLKHRSFPLNTILVHEELNSVMYCLQKHSTEQPRVQCLELLIEHGASLMVTWNGLPVAAHILRDKRHPLYPAQYVFKKSKFNASNGLSWNRNNGSTG